MDGEQGEKQGARTVRLTDKIAKGIEAPPAGFNRPALIVWDDGVRGFGLRVTRATEYSPTGVRSFVLSYRTRGKGEERTGAGIQRTYTIGRFPDDFRTVSAARAHAQELRRQIAQGADPMGSVHEHRAACEMNELANRYINEHAEPKKRAGSLREDQGLLKQWIRPELGGKKVRDVSSDDIEKLHAKITAAGTPLRANRVHALLSKMFALAIRWKMRTDNPCKGVEKNPEHERRRYLKPDELQNLIKALAESENQDAANVVRLLLLTGARRGEAFNAQWSQFDLGAGTWTKPAHMTKQDEEHHIPLSAPAKQLLVDIKAKADAGVKRAAVLEREAAKEKRPKRRVAKLNAAARARLIAASPYVFPGFAGDDAPLNNIRRFWVDLCKRAALEDFRIHDLRHSYASFLVSSGLSLPVIGALLGHTQASTTQRYSHLLLDPLRAATDKVGALVSAIETGKTAEVKQFSKR